MVKMPLSTRQSNIGYIVGNKLIPDFYQTGFDKLPYDESTRAEFFRFRDVEWIAGLGFPNGHIKAYIRAIIHMECGVNRC